MCNNPIYRVIRKWPRWLLSMTGSRIHIQTFIPIWNSDLLAYKYNMGLKTWQFYGCQPDRLEETLSPY